MVVNNQPYLDFTLDLFEEPGLSDNVIVLMGHSRQRPSIRNRNDSTRPPAKRGVPGKPVPANRKDRWGKRES